MTVVRWVVSMAALWVESRVVVRVGSKAEQTADLWAVRSVGARAVLMVCYWAVSKAAPWVDWTAVD